MSFMLLLKLVASVFGLVVAVFHYFRDHIQAAGYLFYGFIVLVVFLASAGPFDHAMVVLLILASILVGMQIERHAFPV